MENRTDQPGPGRVLAVFAHPDDEVFCAGGTLAQYAAKGAECMVVSATQGEAGQIRDAKVATRRVLGQVRAQELQGSCKQLGVQHALCLDYGDGTLRGSDPQALTAKITQLIRDFKPDVVITFGPDGAYGHPDHIAISDITTEAFQRAAEADHYPEQLATGLSLHQPGRLYYSYFPRSQKLLSDRLVQWLVKLETRFHGSVDFAHALLLFSEESTMLGYSSDHFELAWFPTGFYVVEQGEPATKLYLILSGKADVIHEDSQGTLHTLAHIKAGDFFGEEGLAYQQPRNAHVVVTEDATCLVFSPEASSNFAGRGAEAHLTAASSDTLREQQPDYGQATTCIDVSNYVQQKMAAMAAHKTQFSVRQDMFPLEMLRDLFGQEYFVRVFPPTQLESSLF
jgi:LmbE family N-acetylglucosaminyl deacetylase